MIRVARRLLTALVVLTSSLAFANSKTDSLPIITGGSITEPSQKTITFIREQTSSLNGAPLTFSQINFSGAEFCGSLGKRDKGIYVALLSVYRRCYKEQRALRAFDFPFLASDWTHARQVLNGPMGFAIAESLNERGVSLLSFWDGDSRVLSSHSPITSPKDLSRKKIIAPDTFASQTVLAESGGIPVVFRGADVPMALEQGTVDSADTSLGFFSQALTDAHMAVLVSNHSLDPYVVAAPDKVLTTLTAEQRGLLETLLRQATAFQVSETQKTVARILGNLKERGIEVTPLTESVAKSFKTPLMTVASRKNAMDVFADSSPDIRAGAISQAQGQTTVPYWTVFFVTNRAMANGKLNNTIGQYLLYGTAKVEIEYVETSNGYLSGAWNHLKRLVTFDQAGKGIVIDWSTISSTPFADSFARVPPSKPAEAPLVYVHGFANTFEEALRRAAWIGWNVKRPVVVFAWPSLGHATPGDYRTDRETAAQSVEALENLLTRLGLDYDTETDVDVVVHSMGASVLLGALEKMDKKTAPGKAVRFRQLVLVAPDVAAQRVKQDWVSLTKYFEKFATLYVSDHDLALGISRKFMNPKEGPRAGLAPPVLVTDRIETIFIGPNDFSFTGHSYHVANGVIADDILELLRYGTSAELRRGSLLSPTGQHYYELRRLQNP